MYEWVKSHVWMSQVTCMNESSHMYEWGMSHVWVNHDTYVQGTVGGGLCESGYPFNESRHMYMHESRRMYQWVTVTHRNESRHMYVNESSLMDACVISHMCSILCSTASLSHTQEWVTSHVYKWIMSHGCMRHITYVRHKAVTKCPLHIFDDTGLPPSVTSLNESCLMDTCVTYVTWHLAAAL